MSKRDFVSLAVAFIIAATVAVTTGNTLFGTLTGALIQAFYGVGIIAYQRGADTATQRFDEALRVQVAEPTAQTAAILNGQVTDDVPTGGAR